MSQSASSIIPFPKPEEYASLAQMASWAQFEMQRRAPDVVITTPGAEEDYLRRWWVIPRNEQFNVYLHRFLRSDDDRALHDHPWDNQSWLLEGEYLEHTPYGVLHRRAGDYIERAAKSAHRIELIDGKPTTSLFITGPKIREWGFFCPQGWVHWQTFTAGPNGGRGCAE